MLCNGFLFRVPGVGWRIKSGIMRRMDSNELFARLSYPTLRAQYEAIREEHRKKTEGINPTTSCGAVEGSMYTWIGFEKYVWMPEQTVDGVLYPKIAVKRGTSTELKI